MDISVNAAQEKFVSSLKERLVAAGKKNLEITEKGEENQKKAMENLAEAFSDPVKEFIDDEANGGTQPSITSYDKSVSVKPVIDPVSKKTSVDLSVYGCSSNEYPLMDGVKDPGHSRFFSRSDHVHPTDTSREAVENKRSDIRGSDEASDTEYGSEKAVREAIESEANARAAADEEIISSLEEEAAARQVNDELLEEQIREVAVQTDWEEKDSTSLAYLKNHPLEMTDSEIDNLINALD